MREYVVFQTKPAEVGAENEDMKLELEKVREQLKQEKVRAEEAAKAAHNPDHGEYRPQ